jgi:hypothetical protein
MSSYAQQATRCQAHLESWSNSISSHVDRTEPILLRQEKKDLSTLIRTQKILLIKKDFDSQERNTSSIRLCSTPEHKLSPLAVRFANFTNVSHVLNIAAISQIQFSYLANVSPAPGPRAPPKVQE